MSTHAKPVGGRSLTPPFSAARRRCSALGALADRSGGWSPASAPTTALNDGYPWGLWIAFDVVTGTALACGGYAVALLVYILNKGKYHPLVRPAMLTSALGYTLAGARRRARRRPVVEHLAGAAVLLALEPQLGRCSKSRSASWPTSCVLWIELSPAFLEQCRADRDRRGCSASPRGRCRSSNKALLWIIALGMLLPTMHQSSLGSLMLLAGPRLHPLWHTGAAAPVPGVLHRDGLRGRRLRVGLLVRRCSSASRRREMLAGLAAAIVPFAVVVRRAARRRPRVARPARRAVRARPLQRDVAGSRSSLFLRRRSCMLLGDAQRRTARQPVPRRDGDDARRRVLPLRHLPGRVQPGRGLVATSRASPEMLDHPRPGRRSRSSPTSPSCKLFPILSGETLREGRPR